MSAYEYRVVVKRAGGSVHYKRYGTERGAQRRLTLYGPEPWTAFGANPDDQFCCSGHECCCGGVTVREHHQERRSQLPALEFAYIERREVGEWHAKWDEGEPVLLRHGAAGCSAGRRP